MLTKSILINDSGAVKTDQKPYELFPPNNTDSPTLIILFTNVYCWRDLYGFGTSRNPTGAPGQQGLQLVVKIRLWITKDKTRAKKDKYVISIGLGL